MKLQYLENQDLEEHDLVLKMKIIH